MRKLWLFFLLVFLGTTAAQAQYPPLEIAADQVFTAPYGTVDVPIRAGSNWQNITSFAGTLHFDTTVISFNSLQYWGLTNPSGAAFNYLGNGDLSFSWTSLISIGPTLNLGDIVFTLRFNVLGNPGDISPVDFTNSPTQLNWRNGFGWSGNNFIAGNGQVVVQCSPPPVQFSYTSNTYTLNFTESTPVVGSALYLWDFGDGNTSTSQNPSHTYANTGNYTVCLVVADSCGTDSTCQTVNVSCPVPNSAFTNSSNNYTQTFTDQSSNSPTGWLWDFGDGNTSTMQNPVHTYSTTGNYTVCLTVTGTCGSDSSCQTVNVTCPVPNAGFSNTPNNLDLTFTDQSTNSPTSWLWDFGDGNTSTNQNPSHTYAAPGNYMVCLTVTGSCGTDSSCQNINVTCPTPGAAFTNSGSELAYTFTDQSNNSPASWDWDFGDGNTSNSQNPSHTYTAPGTYTVCLISTNSCGSDTSCSNIVVTCSAPSASFSHSVAGFDANFMDSSTDGPTSWFWDFGDGNTSSLQNPVHTYGANGNYLVCLTSSSICGADTTCDTVVVNVVGLETVEENSWSVYPNPASEILRVQSAMPLRGIQIMDLSGRILMRKDEIRSGQEELSVDQLPSGLYLVRVLTGQGWEQRKFVKR